MILWIQNTRFYVRYKIITKTCELRRIVKIQSLSWFFSFWGHWHLFAISFFRCINTVSDLCHRYPNDIWIENHYTNKRLLCLIYESTIIPWKIMNMILKAMWEYIKIYFRIFKSMITSLDIYFRCTKKEESWFDFILPTNMAKSNWHR